jgi:hypothetical protein
MSGASSQARCYILEPDPTPNIPGTKTNAEYLPLIDNSEQLIRHQKFAHECLSKAYNFDMYGFTHLSIKRMMYLFTKDHRNYPDLAWEDPKFSRSLNRSSRGLLAAISPTGQLPNLVPVIMMLPNVFNPWYLREKKRHDIQREFWVGFMQTVSKTQRTNCMGGIH